MSTTARELGDGRRRRSSSPSFISVAAAVLTGVATLAIAGMGGGIAGAKTKQLQTVSVAINGFNGIQVPMIMAASEPKILAKYGVKLSVEQLTSEADAVPAVTSGSVDFASIPPEVTFKAQAKGAPIVITTATVVKNPYTLVATSGISSPKQLSGVTFAVGAIGVSLDWSSLREYLGHLGFSTTQYHFIATATPAGTTAALANGSVHAAALFQPGLGTVLAKPGYHQIAEFAKLPQFRNVDYAGLDAEKSWLSSTKALAVKFVRAYITVIHWMYTPKNKKAAIKDMEKTAHFTPTQAVNTYKSYMTLKEFSVTEAPSIQRLINQLKADASAGLTGLPTPSATTLKPRIDAAIVAAARK